MFLAKMRAALRAIRDIPRLASIVGAKSIARRMFVTNAFDGLLSTLGIILGLYLAGVTTPQSYLGAVLGGTGVMGVFSGFVATYLSERAERLRELHETERVMVHSLQGSIYERAAKLVPLYVATWSAVGAILLPALSVTPIAACLPLGRVTPLAVYTSIAVILVSMFAIGFYLGVISGENRLMSGLKFLAIGASAVLLLLSIRVLLGFGGF